jgi:hypothetical protein
MEASSTLCSGGVKMKRFATSQRTPALCMRSFQGQTARAVVKTIPGYLCRVSIDFLINQLRGSLRRSRSSVTGIDIIDCEIEWRCLDLLEDRVIIFVHLASPNVSPHIRPQILRHGVCCVVILAQGGRRVEVK